MTRTNIIDERISLTQVESEFEKLLNYYIDLKVKNALEIGSYFGYSLHHWLYHSQPEARIISVDLPIRVFCGEIDPRVPVQEYAIQNEWKTWTKRNKNKLQLIQAKSQDPKTVESVLNLLNGEQLDFLFIDGDHRYEAVKEDFRLYAPLVRKGGIVALHDIGEKEEGGVFKLWKELEESSYQTYAILHHPNQEKGIGIVII